MSESQAAQIFNMKFANVNFPRVRKRSRMEKFEHFPEKFFFFYKKLLSGQQRSSSYQGKNSSIGTFNVHELFWILQFNSINNLLF